MNFNLSHLNVKSWINSTALKAKNRRITVHIPVVDKDTKELRPNTNTIYFKSLVSEVGDGPGAMSKVTENGKVKNTYINLTDDALEDLLYVLLIHHKNKIELANNGGKFAEGIDASTEGEQSPEGNS